MTNKEESIFGHDFFENGQNTSIEKENEWK